MLIMMMVVLKMVLHGDNHDGDGYGNDDGGGDDDGQLNSDL